MVVVVGMVLPWLVCCVLFYFFSIEGLFFSLSEVDCDCCSDWCKGGSENGEEHIYCS